MAEGLTTAELRTGATETLAVALPDLAVWGLSGRIARVAIERDPFRKRELNIQAAFEAAINTRLVTDSRCYPVSPLDTTHRRVTLFEPMQTELSINQYRGPVSVHPYQYYSERPGTDHARLEEYGFVIAPLSDEPLLQEGGHCTANPWNEGANILGKLWRVPDGSRISRLQPDASEQQQQAVFERVMRSFSIAEAA